MGARGAAKAARRADGASQLQAALKLPRNFPTSGRAEARQRQRGPRRLVLQPAAGELHLVEHLARSGGDQAESAPRRVGGARRTSPPASRSASAGLAGSSDISRTFDSSAADRPESALLKRVPLLPGDLALIRPEVGGSLAGHGLQLPFAGPIASAPAILFLIGSVSSHIELDIRNIKINFRDKYVEKLMIICILYYLTNIIIYNLICFYLSISDMYN